MTEAMHSAKIEWVEGGHRIHPAHPAELAYGALDDEVEAVANDRRMPTEFATPDRVPSLS